MTIVLVIEEWENFLADYGLSEDMGKCILKDFGLPGNVVAQFESKVETKRDWGYTDFVVVPNGIGQGKVHVLLLRPKQEKT